MAATNRDLQRMVSEGRFREDLYIRLQVFPVRLPALRERHEDIPLLATYFMERMSQHLHKRVRRISTAALAVLRQYDWPGNVRELEHVIQRAVIVCAGETIEDRHIQTGLGGEAEVTSEALVPLATNERRYVLQVLARLGWAIGGAGGAAAVLGLNESTLRGRMRKLGIRRPES